MVPWIKFVSFAYNLNVALNPGSVQMVDYHTIKSRSIARNCVSHRLAESSRDKKIIYIPQKKRENAKIQSLKSTTMNEKEF